MELKKRICGKNSLKIFYSVMAMATLGLGLAALFAGPEQLAGKTGAWIAAIGAVLLALDLIPVLWLGLARLARIMPWTKWRNVADRLASEAAGMRDSIDSLNRQLLCARKANVDYGQQLGNAQAELARARGRIAELGKSLELERGSCSGWRDHCEQLARQRNAEREEQRLEAEKARAMLESWGQIVRPLIEQSGADDGEKELAHAREMLNAWRLYCDGLIAGGMEQTARAQQEISHLKFELEVAAKRCEELEAGLAEAWAGQAGAGSGCAGGEDAAGNRRLIAARMEDEAFAAQGHAARGAGCGTGQGFGE